MRRIFSFEYLSPSRTSDGFLCISCFMEKAFRIHYRLKANKSHSSHHIASANAHLPGGIPFQKLMSRERRYFFGFTKNIVFICYSYIMG